MNRNTISKCGECDKEMLENEVYLFVKSMNKAYCSRKCYDNSQYIKCYCCETSFYKYYGYNMIYCSYSCARRFNKYNE